MNIIVGITGSIAAYKCAHLVRGLIKEGHSVRVTMTPSASSFISPLTLSTLSQHKVYTDVSDGEQWENHVELGLWGDLMIIAPASANTLAKMANGQCDNMLLATYLSAKCPIWFAPAMDLDMWKHPATQSNVARLAAFPDHRLIPVGIGALASGLSGPGRMAEPEDILHLVNELNGEQDILHGITALVTAGPTQEAIDPVRFISNHSSGRMGFAIAQTLAKKGATVHLVHGPVDLDIDQRNITCHGVRSAQEMYEMVDRLYSEIDLAVFAAAVADYTPSQVSASKLKKSETDMQIPLKRTKDIALEMGKRKTNAIHIGFALETSSGEDAALAKLQKKAFNIIALNSLTDQGAGFGHNTNKITLFDDQGRSQSFMLKSKTEVAEDIVHYYIQHYKKA
jgi:phosphopantothenoylcysteine decarboxylase/phosphopantothenate--cysteine ligase